MTTQELLGNLGLSVDDLNKAERQTLMSYLETSRTKEMTITDVKVYLEHSIGPLERELTGIDQPDTVVHSPAGLINLRDMLVGPEKAKAALERQLKSLKPIA